MTARAILADAPKVSPRHLGRKALVHVRQSALKQVKENRWRRVCNMC